MLRPAYAKTLLATLLTCTSVGVTGSPDPEAAIQSQKEALAGAPASMPPAAVSTAIVKKEVPATQAELKPAAPEQKRATEKAEDRADRDLRAQEQMAKSTAESVTWAERQYWVALIGVVGSWAGIFATFWAARAARAAAEVATAAVDRAWITVERPELLEIPAQGGTRGRFRFNWKNTGNTPATNVQFINDLRCVDATAARPTFEPVWNDQQPAAIYGPGVGSSSGNLDSSVADFQEFKAGRKVFYLSSAVRYKVTSSNKWRGTVTTFIVRVDGIDPRGHLSYNMAEIGPGVAS